MSVHVTGGAIGNGIAPTIFSAWAQYVGIVWTPLLAVPGSSRSRPAPLRPGGPLSHQAEAPGSPPSALREAARAAVVRRGDSYHHRIGLSVFMPVLMTRRGLSVAQAGLAVTSYLIAGSLAA